MYADLALVLERHGNALKVPATAVGIAGDARFVYVVRAGQLAKLPVTTGISDAGSVEIASGLVGEEEVVTSISPALSEGGKVRAVVSGPTGPASAG
jgi:membrane fusion protein (multidrug efflux system)